MKTLFWCLLIIGLVPNANVLAQAELDTTLNSTGIQTISFGLSSFANDVAVQADNKIVLAGGCGSGLCIARYNENGSLDTSLGGQGFVSTNIPAAAAVAVQNDGKIVVVSFVSTSSTSESMAMVRYNVDGSLDSSFGSGGGVVANIGPYGLTRGKDIAIQPDGKILVVATSAPYTTFPPVPTDFQGVVARYLANGTLDSSFGNGGIYRMNISNATKGQSVCIQPDNKILVGGSMGFGQAGVLVRLNSDGSYDTTWDGDGILTLSSAAPSPNFQSITVQSDGRVVGVVESNTLYRFNGDGSFDTSFDGDGIRFQALDSAIPQDVMVSAGGRITVVGVKPSFEAFVISRFKRDGSYDTSFSGDGRLVLSQIDGTTASGAYGGAVDSYGRVLVAGYVGNAQGNRFAIVRLVATTVPSIPGMIFDFDGDQRADIAVYRDGPTPGAPSYWHILRSSDGVYQGIQLGSNGDKPVPSDYNGDGITEVAVWRPSTGTWFTSTNPATNYGAYQWGQNGDVPLPGDFDGDGKADYVVYRTGNGTWYVIKSSNGGFQMQQFGGSTDKPLLGDFDGDGKTDFAYYRPGATALAASFWNVIQSSNGAITSVQYGRGEDKPVPGDYDGDGLTNFAVFRPSTSTWFTSLNPAINYGAFQWGANGDVPSPADYDGDTKTDFAVFRPGDTVWYILNSGNGSVVGRQWGIASDRPVPSSYIP